MLLFFYVKLYFAVKIEIEVLFVEMSSEKELFVKFYDKIWKSLNSNRLNLLFSNSNTWT